MNAIIVARTKTRVMVRIPDLHPRRILTLPIEALPGAKGDNIQVEVRSGIESSEAGYTALVVPCG